VSSVVGALGVYDRSVAGRRFLSPKDLMIEIDAVAIRE
jgi:hypothetical protein